MIIELVLILIIVALIAGIIIYFTIASKGKALGEKCAVNEDCAGYGTGETQNACCKGICTQKINNWCPGEGANVGVPIGGACKVATDCQAWGWGWGGKGTLCCHGKCTENPDKLIDCPTAVPRANAECGNAAGIIPYTQTEWGDRTQACALGTPNITLSSANFPRPGAYLPWTCTDTEHQVSIPCSATHSYPPQTEIGSMLQDGVYRIYQVGTGRYLDIRDVQVVTRPYDQGAQTQKWILKKVNEKGDVKLIHLGTNLRLDAYQVPENDYNVVLRPDQNNTSQTWNFAIGEMGTSPVQWRIRQVISNRDLDAYADKNDYRAVTRPVQLINDKTQDWVLVPSDPAPTRP